MVAAAQENRSVLAADADDDAPPPPPSALLALLSLPLPSDDMMFPEFFVAGRILAEMDRL